MKLIQKRLWKSLLLKRFLTHLKNNFKERKLEKEAELKAKDIMKRYGDFAQDISEMFMLRMSIDNENVKTLMDLFN